MFNKTASFTVRIQLSLFLIKATVLHSRKECDFDFVFCCLINIKGAVCKLLTLLKHTFI